MSKALGILSLILLITGSLIFAIGYYFSYFVIHSNPPGDPGAASFFSGSIIFISGVIGGLIILVSWFIGLGSLIFRNVGWKLIIFYSLLPWVFLKATLYLIKAYPILVALLGGVYLISSGLILVKGLKQQTFATIGANQKIKHALIWILIPVILVILSSFWANFQEYTYRSPISEDTKTWITYTDQENKYSFKHPPELIVSQLNAQGTGRFIGEKGVSDEIKIQIDTVEWVPFNRDNYLKVIEIKNFQNGEVIIDQYIYTYIHSVNDLNIHSVLKYNDREIYVEFFDKHDNFRERKINEDFLNSIKFL